MTPDPPERIDRGLARAAPPAPLLAPAIAMIAGIVVSEAMGVTPRAGWAWLGVGAGFACLALVPRGTTAAVAATAMALGFLRHQGVSALPPDHVARLVESGPELTRVEVRVVTPPITRPTALRNPYLRAAPTPRAEFVADALALRLGDAREPVQGRLAVAVESDVLEAAPGDRLVLSGTLYRFRGPRNPGQRDGARFRRLAGVEAGLHVPGLLHVVRQPGSDAGAVQQWVNWLRGAGRRALLQPYADGDTDAVPLLQAIVLGQRSAVSRSLNDAFVRIGAVHVLSVSGFHVGLLGVVVWSVTGWLTRGSVPAAAAATSAAMLAYALLAESNAPILRATILGLFYCAARLRGRAAPALNWLAAAALTVLMLNPRDVLSAGFQLSFVQVLALTLILPRVKGRLAQTRTGANPWTDREPRTLAQLTLQRVVRAVALAACVAAVCWLTAIPLTVYHFGLFTPWGIVQSLLVLPLAACVVVIGFAQVAASLVPGAPAALIVPSLRASTDLLMVGARWMASWPGTSIVLAPPPVWLVASCYALALAAVAVLRRSRALESPQRHRRRREAAGLGCLALAPVVWCGWWLAEQRGPAGESVELHVLDVGAGSANLLRLPSRDAVVLDVGTMENWDVGVVAADAMRATGVRGLLSAWVSHADLDHISGLPSLLERFPARAVFVGADFEARWGAQQPQHASRPPWGAARLRSIRAGERYDLERERALEAGQSAPAVYADVLWPPAPLDEAWSDNDGSLVILVSAWGRRVLLPGDIERRAMEALLDEADAGALDLRCDVLIAPHHGAVVPLVTERFYTAACPRWVIASTDRDRRRLAELVERALGGSCRLVTTRDCGAVRVTIRPEGSLEVSAPFTDKHAFSAADAHDDDGNADGAGP